ncbi:hypothetical protein Nlim_0451 [Candidatus Nitrosarchaeum limnium SFB1]|jgi:hypothetical protein|uniref:Uncharacterized protein n=1 Tax=Candidatus Nitrosarchaeum limnium SFB1 TaxID=886738 RepID=F3KIZ7_9ARCH|nr:hypothetical protein Nlim_0451 [Candidatus Nitrosarchaeum limnium SFB1]
MSLSIRSSICDLKEQSIRISDQLKLSKNDSKLATFNIEYLKDKAKIWQILDIFMDDLPTKQLKDLYGLNPNIPHLALQFPRLPPGLSNPVFKIFENPMKEKFADDNALINKKLHGFQQSYQKYASGLLNMTSGQIIPPGHPLFSQQNSVNSLKEENDKLLKENLELKKKLDAKKGSKRN